MVDEILKRTKCTRVTIIANLLFMAFAINSIIFLYGAEEAFSVTVGVKSIPSVQPIIVKRNVGRNIYNSGRTLVLLNHQAAAPAERENLNFFIHFAMQDENLHVLLMTPEEINYKHPRLEIIRRPLPVGQCGLTEIVNRIYHRDRFQNFIFVKTNARGPMLPTYYDFASWSKLLSAAFHPHLSMLGTTINCMNPCATENCTEFSLYRFYPQSHLQSQFWMFDRTGMDLFDELLNCHDEIENALTVQFASKGLTPMPLQMNFKYIAPNDAIGIQRACDMHDRGPPSGDGNIVFDEKGIAKVRLHPIELMFHLTGHDRHRIWHQKELIAALTSHYDAASSTMKKSRRNRAKDRVSTLTEPASKYHVIVAMLPSPSRSFAFVADHSFAPDVTVSYICCRGVPLIEIPSSAETSAIVDARECDNVACAWMKGLDNMNLNLTSIASIFLMTNGIVGPFLPAYGRQNWRMVLSDMIPIGGVLFLEAACIQVHGQPNNTWEEIGFHAKMHFAALDPKALDRFRSALQSFASSPIQFTEALLVGKERYKMPVEFVAFQWNSKPPDQLISDCISERQQTNPTLPVETVFAVRDDASEDKNRAIDLYMHIMSQTTTGAPSMAPRKIIKILMVQYSDDGFDLKLEQGSYHQQCEWSCNAEEIDKDDQPQGSGDEKRAQRKAVSVQCLELTVFWDWNAQYAQVPLLLCKNNHKKKRVDTQCNENEENSMIGWISESSRDDAFRPLKLCSTSGQLFIDTLECPDYQLLGFVI